MNNNKNGTGWEAELDKVALRNHKIGAWVGIISNPLWIPVDYTTVPDRWETWVFIRIGAALLCLAGLLLRDRLNYKPWVVIFIPALVLSVMCGYMYHVVDFETFQLNTLGYCAFLIGVGFLIIWELKYSLILMGITLGCNILFFNMLSELTVGQVFSGGGIVTLVVAAMSVVMIHNRYKNVKKEIQARLEVEEAKMVIEMKNQSITDSIAYAKHLQEAILPAAKEVESRFNDNMIMYCPKDVVSGDFYWIEQIEQTTYLAVADCTGHGVPGAMVSVVCSNALDRAINEYNFRSPAEILNKTRELVVARFAKQGDRVMDGMDIGLCAIEGDKLTYTGANNPLWLIRKTDEMVDQWTKGRVVSEGNKTLYEIKGDSQPVGFYKNESSFKEHEISLQGGDHIVLLTDGFADQFGGARKKKFKYLPLKKLMLSLSDDGPEQRATKMNQTFEDWKGDLEQVDDVCILDIKV